MSEAERKRQTLREQLSRAGGALAHSLGLRAKAGKRGAVESKQRLSDVLWNDRSLAAAHAVTNAPRAEDAADADSQAQPQPPAEPRQRVATPSQPVPKPAPIPAGAFAKSGRERRQSPPPPVPERRTTESVLSDLESLMAADERQVRVPPSPPSAASQRQPPPIQLPPPRTSPPPPPPPVATDLASQPVEPIVEAPAVVASVEVPAPSTPAAQVSSPTAARADDADADDDFAEPICTRSMARLLAGQGHRDRALRIYAVLLAQNAEDAGLRAEADALRQGP